MAALEVSSATLNKERTYMRQFFRWAKLRSWCEDEPLATIQRFTEEKREIRVLSPEEEVGLLRASKEPYFAKVIALRNAGGKKGGASTKDPRQWQQPISPPSWLHPLLHLALRTGLRYGTLEKLEWSEVDLKDKVIRISPKKMKAREALTVPLDEETVALLADLKSKASSTKVLAIGDQANVRKTFLRAVEGQGFGQRVFTTFVQHSSQDAAKLELTWR